MRTSTPLFAILFTFTGTELATDGEAVSRILSTPSAVIAEPQVDTPKLHSRASRLSAVREELREELRNHPSEGGRWDGLPRDEYIAEVDEWASNLLVIMEDLSDTEKVAVAKELANHERVDYSTYFAYQVAAKYADGPVELPPLTPHDPQESMLAYGIVDRYGLELYRRSGIKTDETVLQLKVEALKSAL
jgi:hypothetical protein